jgi:SAM-dependent methyltransferase
MQGLTEEPVNQASPKLPALSADTPPRWRIVIYSPPLYSHAAAFLEVAESVMFAIRHLGFHCDMAYNALLPGAVNILFGSNLMDQSTADQLPDDTILFNLEQIDSESNWLKRALPGLIARLETWDYSARNIENIKRLFPARSLHHVPIGYVPELSSIRSSATPDIDVLFYGSLSARRSALLDALQARGVNVVRAFNVYGPERDAMIARARVVLNIHSYSAKVLEIARISYLLANGKAVVSECDPDTELPDGIGQVVKLAPYDGLVDACVQLLANDAERRELGRRGFEWMCARPASRYLAPMVERLSSARRARPAPAMPNILHFSRALVREPRGLYLDDASPLEVDAVIDYRRGLPLGEILPSDRFGGIRLLPGSFDEISIGDNLTWVADLNGFMRDCALLLKPGGRLSIQVPHCDAERAWSDPRTVRAFSPGIWQSFQDAHIRLGWPGVALSLVDLQARLSPLGQALQGQGHPHTELMSTPKAVDTMIVNFIKRALRPLPA